MGVWDSCAVWRLVDCCQVLSVPPMLRSFYIPACPYPHPPLIVIRQKDCFGTVSSPFMNRDSLSPLVLIQQRYWVKIEILFWYWSITLSPFIASAESLLWKENMIVFSLLSSTAIITVGRNASHLLVKLKPVMLNVCIFLGFKGTV